MVEILSLQSEDAVKLLESGAHQEWIDLINNGFGGTPEGDSLENAIHEVNFPNRATIFVAKDGYKIIGYAAVMRYANNDEDKRGKLMRKAMLDLFGFIPKDEFIGVEISSIVVDERYRGQGIGMQLYQQVVKDLNPCFINGFTKNPIAVGARIKALPEYEVFWGGIPLTNNDKALARNIQSIYFQTKPPKESIFVNHEGMIIGLHANDVDIIPTDLIDLTSLKDKRRILISSIINEAQQNRTDKVIFAPLVCVRKDLINKLIEH